MLGFAKILAGNIPINIATGHNKLSVHVVVDVPSESPAPRATVYIDLS